MKYTKEAKTGLLAVFAIALFIFGYNYLKGSNLLSKERTFYVMYENVEGLDASSFVTINGMKVGKVQEISLVGQEGFLLVRFNVNTDFEFSKTSIARIYGGGIIGGKSLAIVPDPNSRSVAVSGDTLRGDIEEGIMELVNERLTPLQKKIENTVVSTDSLLNALNDILNEQAREDLRNSISNFSEITESFAASSKSVEKLLEGNSDKFDRTFDNLDIAAKNFAVISDSLSQLQVGQLVSDIENAISSFNEVATKLKNGEGSIGKLLQDDTLYENLENASRQLEELLQDVKLNPKRYVHFSLFGRNTGPYQPPSDPNK